MRLLTVVLSVLLPFLSSSCCFIRIPHFYNTSTLAFEETEANGWQIIAPPPGVWESQYRRSYLPEYFPQMDMLGDTMTYSNFFYATLDLGEARKIALLVNVTGSYGIRRIIYDEGECVPDTFYKSDKFCMEKNFGGLVICFSPTEAEFDNTSVYFLRKAEKIPSTEITFNRKLLTNGTPLPPNRYDLSSPDFVKEKQPDTVRLGNKTLSYAMLSFLFPMTCRDYENAVFVIDGLYHKGKKLPPLKVRMNYIDLGVVPEYRGPGTANHVPAASQ